MDDDIFYKFKFDKRDIHYGEYVEFRFPSDVSEISDLDNTFLRFYERSLSKEEEKLFFDYLLANMENNLEIRVMAESVYKNLLIDTNLNSSELVYVGQYTMFLCYLDMKYDKDGNVKKGYEEMTIPPTRIYKHLDEDGHYEFERVGLKHDFVTRTGGDSVFEYVQVVCHEMRHYKQSYDRRHGILNTHSFENYVNTIRDKDSSACNYWFMSTELDADDYGYEKAIEIMKKLTPERKGTIDRFTDTLQKHRDNKALAFALLDDNSVFPTDVYEIAKLIREINVNYRMKEEGDEIGFEVYVEELKDLGIIPELFVLTPDGHVKLLSEEELLKKYFSVSEDKKEIYEKALKFYYSLDREGIENYTLGRYINNFSPLKIIFIEEQLRKEEEYCDKVIQIIDNPDLLVRGDPYLKTLIFRNIAMEMFAIRMIRVENYRRFLELHNKVLAAKASFILDKYEKAYIKANSYSTDKELLNMFDNNDDGSLKAIIFNKNGGK